jgi:hypothetical protein
VWGGGGDSIRGESEGVGEGVGVKLLRERVDFCLGGQLTREEKPQEAWGEMGGVREG